MIAGLTLLLLGTAEPTFFEDHARGWFWYEVLAEPEPEPEPTPPAAKPSTTPPPAVLSPREQLTAQGAAWEDAIAAAVLEPTTENVLRYLRLTREITEQAHVFAQQFEETIRTTPQYDYTLQNPVHSQAIIATNEARAHAELQALRHIAEQAGIIFVFRGDCPVCHRFAPLLARYSEAFDIDVIAVSLDGGTLPDYPSPRTNHPFADMVQVTVVPALYLVWPDTGDITPVGFGFTDWSGLGQKLLHAAVRIGLLEQLPDGTRRAQ